VSGADPPGSQEAREFLKGLLVIGRRYDAFAREHPSTAAERISELNAPGVDAGAWDLLWVPATLRPRIARTASTIVLECCRWAPEADKPALMDALMSVAIVSACVVAKAYGVSVDAPPETPETQMAQWGRVLRAALNSETAEPEGGAVQAQLPQVVECLPPRVRGRLIYLAELLRQEGLAHITVNSVLVLAGAVATDAFDTLPSLA
jgi:hypothetical protein